MGVQTERRAKPQPIPKIPSVPIVLVERPGPKPPFLTPINRTENIYETSPTAITIQKRPIESFNKNGYKNTRGSKTGLNLDFQRLEERQGPIVPQERSLLSPNFSLMLSLRNPLPVRHGPHISGDELNSLINSKWPSPEALQAGPIRNRLNSYELQ